MLARLPGTARSCRTTHPCRSSWASSRAVRRSPAAPHRQATASGLGRNRSPHPAAIAASPPRIKPSRGTDKLPSRPPLALMPRVAATRQGRVRVQAALSAARNRFHLASAEPPGRPTVARTRSATTGRSAPVPASSWSGSPPRWARMACRSAWLSGRTDPLGRSLSSKGNRRGVGLAMEASFLLLAGSPFRIPPVSRSGLVAGTRRAVGLASGLEVAGAVGGALLAMNPSDGGAGPLPGLPLSRIARLQAERPVGVGDLVAAPVVLDLGGGLAPGPPAPGRLRHRAQGLQDIAGPGSLNREAGGASLPGQGPHHLPILRAQVGVGLQPAVPSLLMLAQLLLPIMSRVGLLVATANPPGIQADSSPPRRSLPSMPVGWRPLGCR